MRIAFVSFEFAGVASGGGIGAYVRNASAMLSDRGHDVEVFCGQAGEESGGVAVHSIDATRENFAQAVAPVFAARHGATPFDVVEAAEYGADIAAILQATPELARVIKLHTASYRIGAINEAYLTLGSKARFVIGAIRRGRVPQPFWGRYDAADDLERAVTLAADEITSPSRSLLDLTASDWDLDTTRASVVPNAFVCPPDLLGLDPARESNSVTFLGRLEVRKGVLELARAIPLVLEEVPDTGFRFVGRVLPHPGTGELLDVTIARLAGRGAGRIEFSGAVQYSQISEFLADTAVGVFPSYWENFPYVCLEAMAAGCGVIGSSCGGMAEIIEHGRTGLLVPPRNPRVIAEALIELLRDPARRAAMGAAARAHVVQAYSAEAIAPLQEASYARAIARARQRLAGRTRRTADKVVST